LSSAQCWSPSFALSLTFGATIAAGSLLLGPVFAQDAAPPAAQPAVGAEATTATTPAPATLTLRQVLDKLEAAGYRQFQKIEHERAYFEVEATNPQGQRVELEIDAVTGEILKTEVESPN
jgi:hypothetical protein